MTGLFTIFFVPFHSHIRDVVLQQLELFTLSNAGRFYLSREELLMGCVSKDQTPEVVSYQPKPTLKAHTYV